MVLALPPCVNSASSKRCVIVERSGQAGFVVQERLVFCRVAETCTQANPIGEFASHGIIYFTLRGSKAVYIFGADGRGNLTEALSVILRGGDRQERRKRRVQPVALVFFGGKKLRRWAGLDRRFRSRR